MKNLIIFFVLLIPLGACSSSGDDSPTVTITLTGTVTNIGGQGGQNGEGSPAPGITVTVTDIPKSSKTTGTNGKYSIPDIPAAGDYTVEAEDILGRGFGKITCTIKITDSVTMEIIEGGNPSGQPDSCTKGTGPMVLNITMS